MRRSLSPEQIHFLQKLSVSGRILGPDGQPFPIPAEGSLGLLALGATGLLAWRKRRGKIVSSFVKGAPPKGTTAGKVKKRRGQRQSPDAAPGEDADGPQAGQ